MYRSPSSAPARRDASSSSLLCSVADWRQAPAIDDLPQRWNARVRAIDDVNHDRLVGADSSGKNLSAHKLAAGDLTLLQGNCQVNVFIGQHMALGQIALSVDASHQRIKVFGFLQWRHSLVGACGSAHLLGLVECLEPCVYLVRKRAIGGHWNAISIDINVPLKSTCALGIGD